MGSIIAGLVVVFIGLLIVIILIAQASVANAVSGSITLANAGLFFGLIFASLIFVLFGGYLVGKYVEKQRNEKNNNSVPPPPP